MLLATIVLLGALPQSANLAKSVANMPVAVAETREVGARELPSMPTPKVSAEVSGANSSDSPRLNVSSSTVEPPLAPTPIKPNHPRIRETRNQRLAWYTLAVTGSGAAAFDAYSTRLALSTNSGTESNMLLRPFAHSNALYAATQVSPLVMDYLGKRMMTSQNRLFRKLWWVPQVAGSGISISAGVHNLSVVR